MCIRDRGKKAEAIQILNQSEEKLGLKGKEHPRYTKVLLILGQVYLDSGNLDKATSILEECLKILTVIHKENDHPDIAETALYLSMVNLKKQNSSDARNFIEHSRSILRKSSLPNTNPIFIMAEEHHKAIMARR
eukprot:TRINITY_DN9878_c0_g1_i2.p1 TRINITY_DN9878_c0_g1~~TRINITY_DN9878_c0_g1_i2.p1  ORF type:complete len:134 (+),score=15.23 TRINITY_DN9878_c0_g1_i2:65-466(+)